MRLLSTHTLEFKDFNHHSESIPPYAILSHVWGPNEQTYQDVKLLILSSKKVSAL